MVIVHEAVVTDTPEFMVQRFGEVAAAVGAEATDHQAQQRHAVRYAISSWGLDAAATTGNRI